MARSRRGRLQRGRRVPHPQRCSRPAARPSGPPALTGKASAPPRTDGSPPPRESGHGKGKEEPRLVCQGLGYPSPSSLRPRSPGPQTLLPQTQESRAPSPSSLRPRIQAPGPFSLRPRSPGPPDPPPSDPGVQEPTPRPHRDPSISSPAFPEVSGVDSWFSSQLLLSCLPGLHLFPLLPSSYFSNLCP